MRQRGTAYRAGDNVGVGTDHTLFALTNGTVQFKRKGVDQRVHVSVEPGKPIPDAPCVTSRSSAASLREDRRPAAASEGPGDPGAFCVLG